MAFENLPARFLTATKAHGEPALARSCAAAAAGAGAGAVAIAAAGDTGPLVAVTFACLLAGAMTVTVRRSFGATPSDVDTYVTLAAGLVAAANSGLDGVQVASDASSAADIVRGSPMPLLMFALAIALQITALGARDEEEGGAP